MSDCVVADRADTLTLNNTTTSLLTSNFIMVACFMKRQNVSMTFVSLMAEVLVSQQLPYSYPNVQDTTARGRGSEGKESTF